MSTDALPATHATSAAGLDAADGTPPTEAIAPADEPASAPGETGADSAAAESAGADAPRAAIPRRYLAGKSSADPYRPQFPHWFRALLLGAAALVSVMALLALLRWPFAADVDKPLLVCLAVEEYTSGAMPPLEFVRQDAERVLRAARDGYRREAISESVLTAFDRKDFEQFFSSRLRSAPADTHVIYLIAHGLSDDRGAYLIPSDGQPDQPENGYRIDRLLDALVELPSKNVLLLLDCCRIQHDVSFGILQNRFAQQVQEAFERKSAEWRQERSRAGKNIAVLLSCDQNQRSWASPVLRGTCFAVAVEYCLRGGPEGDLALDGQKQDRWISSDELGKFVRQAVSNWALVNRHQVQTPTLLTFGREFRITPVNHQITLAGLIAPEPPTAPVEIAAQAPADDAPTDGAEAPAKVAAAPSDGDATASADPAAPPAAAEDGEADATSVTADAESSPEADSAPLSGLASRVSPESHQVLNRLNDLWQEVERFAAASASLQRPVDWCALQQALLRAERHLLAGNPEQSLQILDRDVAKLWKELSKPQNLRPLTPAWSLAALQSAPAGKDPPEPWRAALQREEQLIERCLAEPTAENLAHLSDARSAEAALLAVLASRLVQQGKWQRPRLVRLALQTRTEAEVWSRFNRPGLFVLYSDSLDQADADRLQGTTELLGRQYDLAQQNFESALRTYRKIASGFETVVAQMSLVQQTALAIPSLLSWIDHDPLSPSRREKNSQLLREFIGSLQTFAASPGQEPLQASAELAAALAEQLQRYAVASLEPVDWQATIAVLQTGLLPAELRHKLLQALLTIPDGTDFSVGFRQHAVARRDAAPILQNWLVYLQAVAGDLSNGGFDGKSLVQTLETSLKEQKRQTAAEPLLRIFARTARGQHLLPPAQAQDADWKHRVRALALSRFIAIGMEGRKTTAAAADLFAVASQQQLLNWMADRLSREANRLPPQSLRNPLRTASDEIHRFAPEFRFPVREPVFQIADARPIAIDLQQSLAVPLVLRSRRDLPAEADPKFVLQWDPATANCRLVLDGEPSSSGRFERGLGDVLAQREYRFSLQVIPTGDSEQCDLSSLSSCVRTSDGTVDWLPWEFTLQSGPQKAAEILVEWDDRGANKGRIDLYPNQSLPLRVAVRRLIPGDEPLRLEVVGRNTSRRLPLAGSLPVGEPMAVDVPADIDIPFADDLLTFQLLAGDALIDERHLQVRLLNLDQCFRRQVTYDPLERRLTARIERVHQSDVPESIPFSLQLLDNHGPQPELVQGNLAVRLPADASQTFLQTRIPVGATQPYRLALSAAWTPRLFRYQLSQQQLEGTPDDTLTLRSIDPEPGERILWQEAGAQLPIRLELDGPQEMEFSAGFDQNRNGQLDDWERQERRPLWFGRDVRLALVAEGAEGEPPTFVVRSQVGDVTATLDLTGQAGAQTVLIRAVGGPQTGLLQIPIFVLKSAPAVTALFPVANSAVGAGVPLEVTVQVDPELAPAVDDVEFAFDRNDNGEIDKEELLPPPERPPGAAPYFAQGSRAVFTIPTEGQPVGGVSLLLRAVTRVQDETAETGIRELRGPICKHPLRFANTGHIAGTVKRTDGSPEAGATVHLSGRPPVVTGPDGSFQFLDVAVGSYVLQAATPLRYGQFAVTVSPAKTVRADITIGIR